MEKNYLLSFTNNKKSFPIEKIDKDCLQYKELLFESNQIFDKTNKSILGNSFLVNNKPTIRNTKLWRQNINENSDRHIASDVNSSVNDTLEFLRGDKLDSNEVANFVKGTKQESKVPSNINTLKNVNTVLEDSIPQEVEAKKEILNDTMINNPNISADISSSNDESLNEYFKNPNDNNRVMHMLPNLNAYPMPQMIPIPIQNMQNIPNVQMPSFKFESLNIENIFLFNKKINFPVEQPLWYICYPLQPHSIIGPLSSKQILDSYNRKIIDGNVDFRPIDIFNFYNVQTNKLDFAKLKLINSNDWYENIKDSPLLQYTELFFTSKKLLETSRSKTEKIEGNLNKNHQNEKVVVDLKGYDNDNIEINKNKKPDNLSNKIEDQTLHLTQQGFRDDSEEIENFMTDTVIQNKHNDTTIIDIGKYIEGDSTNWEKIDKKKKKIKDRDESFYLIGNKPKKDEGKKENKQPSYKVDIIPPEELVKQLIPKHLREENKPKFEAFVVDNENDFQASKGKKKNKGKSGKPQEVNLKLGFKY